MQVNISWRHIKPNKLIEEYISKKLTKLERFSKHIQEVNVIISKEGQQNSVEFHVIIIKTPGILVKEQNHSIHYAFDSCLSMVIRKIKEHESKARKRK